MASRSAGVLLLLTAWAGAPLTAAAQTAPTEPPQEIAGPAPRVSLTIDRTSPDVTESMALYVWIRNFQSDSAFSINRILFRWPPGLEGRAPSCLASSPDKCPDEDAGGPEDLRAEDRATAAELRGGSVQTLSPSLGRGGEMLIPVEVRGEESWIDSLLDVKILLFQPREYSVHCTVEYQLLASSKPDSPPPSPHYLFEPASMNLEPPLASRLAGGVVGAFLLALFVPIYRLREMSDRLTLVGLAQLGGRALTLFVAGAAVSLITILLLISWGELELPVAVEVNDFYGGLVVGLFSYVIGERLYRRLIGAPQSSPQPQQPPQEDAP